VVAIGELLAYIAEPGEEVWAVPVAVVEAAVERPVAEGGAPTQPAASAGDSGPIAPAERAIASPIAKRLAKQYGVDLAAVKGSGPGGRILEADVERAAQKLTDSAGAEPAYQDVELSRLQKVTAERLSEAQRSVPQFVLEVEVDVTSAASLRERQAAADGFRPSYTTIVARAVAVALREHPEVNASYYEGKRRLYSRVNLGVAVAVPEGLIVPVLARADELPLKALDQQLRALVERTRAGNLRPEEAGDGTFTVSNLGMFAVDAFQAVINPPQAGILAVGRIRDAVVAKDGMIGIRPVVTLRLTIDHRILDGATAARFLGRVKELLEEATLLT
jgi:pyruvate dehydrogenase E2 component (dihydrolipoamide acetyltransferase)